MTRFSNVMGRRKERSDIERDFRVRKDAAAAVASMRHRLAPRVGAHAMISLLALVLHRVMRQRPHARGADPSSDAALKPVEAIQQYRVRVGEQTDASINASTPEPRDLFTDLENAAPSLR